MSNELIKMSINRILDILHHRTCDLSKSPYASAFQCQGDTQFITTNGIGAKTQICFEFNRWDTIGIDLIAMNVNDLICHRAVPYMFANHISVQTSDPDREEQIARGILMGADEALLGLCKTEYSVIPSVIKGVNLIGTCLGYRMLPEKTIQVGDVLIGLSSSGIHCSGLNVARVLVVDEEMRKLLLVPTKIYVRTVIDLLHKYSHRIHGLAHIAEGGYKLLDQITEHQVVIDYAPGLGNNDPLWNWLYKEMSFKNLASTFNLGVGFVLFVDPKIADKICKDNDEAKVIGYIAKGSGVNFMGVPL